MTNLSPNQQRATRFGDVLTVSLYGDSEEEGLIDLLTDAMHWADANSQNFHYALAMACRHYINELNDEQQDERRMIP
jgi:hypothetical protein